MKKIIISLTVIISSVFYSYAQPTVCTLSAGPNQTICTPNCANLTATFCPSFQTTSYTQAIIPYAPDPYNAGTGVALTDDSQTGLLPLPFPFCFYGTAYNSFIIGSNGWVGFSVTTSAWFIPAATPTANAGVPKNCHMGPWIDINPSVGGTIRYQTYGTAPCRRLVVSWNAVPMYSCGTPNTHQIALYETTNIIDNFILSKPLCNSWNGGNAIQGTHNLPGTLATVVPGRNWPTQWTVANEGRRWTPAGPATYVLTWFNGVTPIGNTPTINVCPTTTTVYTAQVVYTNCNGQTVTQTSPVTVTVSTLTVTMSSNVNICLGGNTQLTANAVGATTYSWVPATNLSSTTISNPIANPTTTTTYTCYVSNGVCQGTGTVTVTVSPMLTASAGPDDTICSGGNTQLNASGGVIYSWSPGTGLSNINIANPIASPTVTTTYTVFVTDANGCQGQDQVQITVSPAMNLVAAAFPTTCSGNCNGTGSVVASGGFGPYSYSWSNSQLTQNSSGLCAGTYTVWVTDVVGCSINTTIVVTSPTALVLTPTAVTANCGQSDGSACAGATGGTPPYTYTWNLIPNTSCISNIPSGTYTIVVTDANGCTATANILVPNTPGVVLSSCGSTNVTCFNLCDGTAIVCPVNGTPPYAYNWLPNGGNAANATGLCAGTYTCTVTDASGCSDTAVVTITQPAMMSVTPPPPVTICIGQCTNLTATATGGNGTYTYNWMPGNLTGATVNVCPTVTTVYSVIATDGNSCPSQPGLVTVTVNPPLTAIASNGLSLCPGACTNISALAGGGNGGPYTYNWMPGNMTTQQVNVCPTTTTTYTVTISDGCTVLSATDTINVTVLASPVVSFTSSDSAGCEPLCINFSSNSTNIATYNWIFSGGSPGSSNQQNPANICFNTPGNYNITLSVIDNSGCTASMTASNMITVYPNPIAAFTATPQPTTTLNGTITFINLSSGASTYLWNFDPSDVLATSTQQNPFYEYTDSGTYVVTLIVTSQYGCTDSTSETVIIFPDYTFWAPNAFTPNDDGLNEVFIPEGMYIDPTDYQLFIFDRWGNLIFETTSVTQGWDGRANGGTLIAQEDVYVWKVLTKDNQGYKHQYVGHVSLIR